MNALKVIKSKEQYYAYVNAHKNLWKNPTDENEEERELLDVLIEKWERETLKHQDTDPIELLTHLMENHNLSASQLSMDLGITKGTMSKILNRKKGLSKYVIRKLAEKFKLRQEAFNRDYPLEADFVKKPAKKVKHKIAKKVKKPTRKLAKV